MKSQLGYSGELTNTIESIAGVYALSDQDTGYAYIGSTTDYVRREKEQFSALRGQRHYNCYLQSAYDTLGETRIKFVPLEAAESAEELVSKEQEWINRIAAKGLILNINLVVPSNRPGGHKLSLETRARQSRAKKGRKIPIEKTRAKRYSFVTPEGEIVKTVGLRSFAETHGLNLSNLSKLARGKLEAYRGFTYYRDNGPSATLTEDLGCFAS